MGRLTGNLAWQPRAKWSNLTDDSCARSPIKNYNSFFPSFRFSSRGRITQLGARLRVRAKRADRFSPHPPRPDAFDVHARKGFRETAPFFLRLRLPQSPPHSTLVPLSVHPSALLSTWHSLGCRVSEARSLSLLTRQAASARRWMLSVTNASLAKPHWQKSRFFNWRDARQRKRA